MNGWWCIVVIDKRSRRGHQNETSSSEPETRAIPACLTTSAAHAPEHRLSCIKAVVQRSMCSHPIHRGPLSRLFLSCSIELNCNRLFWVFTKPTIVASGTRRFVNRTLYTYRYTNSFLAPKFLRPILSIGHYL